MLDERAVTCIRQLAEGPGPLLIATDLDGTLTPIVPRPVDARLLPETLVLLERLAKTSRVAIITGRDLNTTRRMVPMDSIIVIGSHGFESTVEAAMTPEVDRVTLTRSLEIVESKVSQNVPDAIRDIEKKAISTAFHFRRDPALEPALRKALSELPANVRLREGRMVFEVLPNGEGGKDRALTSLARHFRPKSVLAMGDDVTDVAMLRAAGELRAQGTQVLCIGVDGGDETPADLESVSDLFLSSSEDAVAALELLAEAMTR